MVNTERTTHKISVLASSDNSWNLSVLNLSISQQIVAKLPWSCCLRNHDLVNISFFLFCCFLFTRRATAHCKRSILLFVWFVVIAATGQCWCKATTNTSTADHLLRCRAHSLQNTQSVMIRKFTDKWLQANSRVRSSKQANVTSPLEMNLTVHFGSKFLGVHLDSTFVLTCEWK